MFFLVNNGTFLGLRAYNLLSRKQDLTVVIAADMFRSFLSSLAGLKGSFLLSRTRRVTIFGVIASFLPRVSGLVSYFRALQIILLEQPMIRPTWA